MKPIGLVVRSALVPSSASRVRHPPATLGRRQAPRRACVVVRAAQQNLSVFEAARRKLGMQVMNAQNSGELAWAAKLNAVLGHYMRLEIALNEQRASESQVQAALANVLAMAATQGEHDGTQQHNAAKSHMWQALLVAGRLRGMELQTTRASLLPPRMTSPCVVCSAWGFLLRYLEGMRHQAWPPEARTWFEALIPAVEDYMAAEERFARYAPTAIAVQSLRHNAADVAAKMIPPSHIQTRDVPLRVQLHWQAESRKKGLTDTVALCHSALLLRQRELAELAAMLAPEA